MARPPIRTMRAASSLPDDLVLELEACASVREVPAQTVVLRQHDRVDELVVLLSGTMMTMVEFSGAGNLAVETSQDVGRVFGWAGMRPPFRAVATVRAETPCRIVTLPVDRVRTLVADEPRWAAALYGLLAAALADRSRDLERQWSHSRRGPPMADERASDAA